MDTSSADYIRHRIARFREAVETTRKCPESLSPFDIHYAAAPYYEKAGIVGLLANLPPDHAGHGEICAEFEAALADLRALEGDLGESWRQMLRSPPGRRRRRGVRLSSRGIGVAIGRRPIEGGSGSD